MIFDVPDSGRIGVRIGRYGLSGVGAGSASSGACKRTV